MTTLPKVTLSEAAIAAVRGAAEDADAGDALRLSIDARFHNELSFGPVEPDDVVVVVDDPPRGGLTVAMDAATAKRADGLAIDFVEGPHGVGFKLQNPNESPTVKPIRPADVRQMLAKGEPVTLVDVRSADERAIASVEHARPLDEAELLALPKDTKLAFMSHHSTRGRRAAQRFFDLGFGDVWWVIGGIDAWSTLDPRVPRY